MINYYLIYSNYNQRQKERIFSILLEALTLDNTQQLIIFLNNSKLDKLL